MSTQRVKVTFYPRKEEYTWAVKNATKYGITTSSFLAAVLLEKYNSRKKKDFDPRKVLPELSKEKAE